MFFLFKLNWLSIYKTPTITVVLGLMIFFELNPVVTYLQYDPKISLKPS